MRAAETPIVGTGRIAAGGRGVRLSVKEERQIRRLMGWLVGCQKLPGGAVPRVPADGASAAALTILSRRGQTHVALRT